MSADKLIMYTIIGISTGLGSWIPTLFGASYFGGWSIFGTLISGFAGCWVYYKIKQSGAV